VKARCVAVGLDLAVAAEHAADVGEIVAEDALEGNVAAGGAAVAPAGRRFGGDMKSLHCGRSVPSCAPT
jgi:hypothetical protein